MKAQNTARTWHFPAPENESRPPLLLLRNEPGERIFTYWSGTGLSRLKVNFIDPAGLQASGMSQLYMLQALSTSLPEISNAEFLGIVALPIWPLLAEWLD